MCYVCGFPELEDDPKEQTYEICPSCGTEFGYNDHGPYEYARHFQLRKIWIDNGCRWWFRSESQMPENWNPSIQLKKANFLDDQLDELKNLKEGWDSYDALIPSEEILIRSRKILYELMNHQTPPEKVLASASGGVAFIYVGKGNHRGVIEILNTGEIYSLLYDTNGNCDTIEWPVPYRTEIPNLANQLRTYLDNDD